MLRKLVYLISLAFHTTQSSILQQSIPDPSSITVTSRSPHELSGAWNKELDINNLTQGIQSRTTCLWNLPRIKYDEFSIIATIQPNRLEVVLHPTFQNPVMIKISPSLSEMPSLEREITIYKLLRGSDTTPEFLGYVTEGGGVTGFVTEYIVEDQLTRDESISRCLGTLRSMHARGISHGDAHDLNCLIRKDGSAVMIDFELAEETWSKGEFERDLDIMSRCIKSQNEL